MMLIRILALWTILEICLSNIKFETIVTPKSHSACTLTFDAAKSPQTSQSSHLAEGNYQ